jgi:hypothetical protein
VCTDGDVVAVDNAVGKDELIQHALQAIRGCLQGDQELTASTITVAIVGVNQPFTIIEGAELQPYVRHLACRVCSRWPAFLTLVFGVLTTRRLTRWKCRTSRTRTATPRWRSRRDGELASRRSLLSQ